jgi:hypothetical protein
VVNPWRRSTSPRAVCNGPSQTPPTRAHWRRWESETNLQLVSAIGQCMARALDWSGAFGAQAATSTPQSELGT